MGRPVAGSQSDYKIDMSHQEVERLLEELEEMLKHTPAEWITAEAAGMWLCHDLGYEDMPEFEDALHGTFEQFIGLMPHIEHKTDEKGRMVIRLKPEPPAEQWQPKKMTLHITDRKQLWNVCVKSPYARVEIPELEFEISADGKRKIDSLYNILGSAIFNLGTHVRTTGQGLSDDHKEKIMFCVGELNKLLDVDTPWTWIVHDPSGLSDFSDMSEVQVEDGPEEEQLQQQQQQQQQGSALASVPEENEAAGAADGADPASLAQID